MTQDEQRLYDSIVHGLRQQGWSRFEAEGEALVRVDARRSEKKSIFVVLRNADFTEGRGPMLIDTIFSTGPEAIKYVEAQQGIFGSKQKVDYQNSRLSRGLYATASGYEIVEYKVLDTVQEKAASDKAVARQKALDKLTPKERTLLGLS